MIIDFSGAGYPNSTQYSDIKSPKKINRQS